MVILDNLEMTLKANMAAKLNAAKNVGGKANGNNANGYRTKERPPSRSRSRASNNLSNPANVNKKIPEYYLVENQRE